MKYEWFSWLISQWQEWLSSWYVMYTVKNLWSVKSWGWWGYVPTNAFLNTPLMLATTSPVYAQTKWRTPLISNHRHCMSVTDWTTICSGVECRSSQRCCDIGSWAVTRRSAVCGRGRWASSGSDGTAGTTRVAAASFIRNGFSPPPTVC